ncbi:hypothetical protein Trydic_g6267 [Trypoxylus dichotomus]
MGRILPIRKYHFKSSVTFLKQECGPQAEGNAVVARGSYLDRVPRKMLQVKYAGWHLLVLQESIKLIPTHGKLPLLGPLPYGVVKMVAMLTRSLGKPEQT